MIPLLNLIHFFPIIFSYITYIYLLFTAPGSQHPPRSPSSPAPTKTRSTSSQPARRSAPSNSPAPCTSPPPQSPKRMRRAWRPAPAPSPGGPHRFTAAAAPPLRSQRAPAQTTHRRNLAHPQRLQSLRQTAQPSARPEQSWPLAPGFTLAKTTNQPSPLTVPPTTSLCSARGASVSLC